MSTAGRTGFTLRPDRLTSGYKITYTKGYAMPTRKGSNNSVDTDTAVAVVPEHDATKDLVFMADAVTVNRDALASVENFQDALRLATETFGEVVSVEELGDGFTVVDKKTLVDVPFLILHTIFKNVVNSKKDLQGNGYVIVHAITADNKKVVFTDGGTGIYKQLQHIVQKMNRKGGIGCAKGLSESSYTYTDGEGKDRPATTYYLDDSATG